MRPPARGPGGERLWGRGRRRDAWRVPGSARRVARRIGAWAGVGARGRRTLPRGRGSRQRHGRPVRSGIPVGAGQGRRLAGRDRRTRARDAGGVERRAAPGDAASGAPAPGPGLTPPVAALGVGLRAGAAAPDAMAPLGPHPVRHPPRAGGAGHTRWGPRHGPRGPAATLAPQAGHRVARREPCWGSGPEAGVQPVHDADGVAASGAHASGGRGVPRAPVPWGNPPLPRLDGAKLSGSCGARAGWCTSMSKRYWGLMGVPSSFMT